MAVPSRFARAAITTVAHAIPASAMIVSVTKGIEPDTLLTMSAMLEELPGRSGGRPGLRSSPRRLRLRRRQ